MVPTSYKVVPVIAPVAIKDNASWTVIDVDTLGFNFVTFIFQLGATDIEVATLKLKECDTSGGSFVDVDGLDYSSDSTLPTAGEDGGLFGFDVEMAGRKRFLRLEATAGDGSAGTFASALAILSRGQLTPTTATERGFIRLLAA